MQAGEVGIYRGITHGGYHETNTHVGNIKIWSLTERAAGKHMILKTHQVTSLSWFPQHSRNKVNVRKN